MNILLILIIIVILTQSNIKGQDCDTYFGKIGICKPITRPNFWINSPHQESQTQILLNSICNYTATELHICCLQNEEKKPNSILAHNGAERYIKNSSHFLTKPPTCGQSFDENLRRNITLGKIKKGQYPWVGSIGEISEDGQETEIGHCTLITARHVLTTAHSIYRGLEKYIRVNYVWFWLHPVLYADAEFLEVPIAEIIIHADYNNSIYVNDIALVKLVEDIHHPEITPICLPIIPQLRDIDYTGLRVLLYATFDTKNGTEVVETRREIHPTKIISPYECKNSFQTFWESTLKVSSICTKKLKDSSNYCNGVGSPLMTAYINPNGIGISYYLIGIRTTGIGVCTDFSFYPEIHLRISDYLDWIEMYLL